MTSMQHSPRTPSESAPARMDPLARLPVFFALHGKRVFIGGGNSAAAWKAELLAASGAAVEVFTLDPCDEMLALAAAPSCGSITIHRKPWDRGAMEGCALVVGAPERPFPPGATLTITSRGQQAIQQVGAVHQPAADQVDDREGTGSCGDGSSWRRR